VFALAQSNALCRLIYEQVNLFEQIGKVCVNWRLSFTLDSIDVSETPKVLTSINTGTLENTLSLFDLVFVCKELRDNQFMILTKELTLETQNTAFIQILCNIVALSCTLHYL